MLFNSEIQHGIEIRIVATIKNNFNFVLADNESTTTVWPGNLLLLMIRANAA